MHRSVLKILQVPNMSLIANYKNPSFFPEKRKKELYHQLKSYKILNYKIQDTSPL